MKRSTSRSRLPFPIPAKQTLNPTLVKKQNNYLQTIGKSPPKKERQRSEVTIREQTEPVMLHPDERRKRTQEKLKMDFLKKMKEQEKSERKGVLRNSLASIRRST